MEFLSFSCPLALSFWLLVGWHQPYGCYGCLDEERRALLDVKAAFDIPGYTSSLGSWVSDGSDCCSWERLRCGSISRRVIRLNLHLARPFADLNEADLDTDLYYTLNATLFLSFQELHSLDLSHNNINGCVPNGGFDRLSKLSKLEFLDLSSNPLPDSILPTLAALTSLKTLSLQGNNMGSELSVHGFEAWSKLSKLAYLDLSLNSLNESVLSTLVRISSLRNLLLSVNAMGGRLPIQELSKLKLEVLDLSGNRFVGNLPALEEEWTSLKAISLSGNKLNGTLPVQGLCKMKNLQELDLSQNELIGVLPSCLGELTSLKFFDVSHNLLQVNFPSSIISNLTSLEYLSLSHNHVAGILFFSSLSNHSNLKMLDLGDQITQLDVETESPVVTPSFQLEGLILSNCNLNKDSGDIPSFLSTQFALKLIDLSNNNLKGYLPSWLFENKTDLDYLNLRNNSLTGPLLLPSEINQMASWLDLSSNELNGELPANFGMVFPNLVYLKLTRNSFHGSIPSSFVYMRKLQYLDLSINSLSGKITDNYLTNWSSLVSLQLSKNKFHGRIPVYSNLSSLAYMLLDGNQFIGEIPTDICNYSELFNLDISGNQLSGRIPDCLGELPQLVSLDAKGNSLEGHIPNGFCNFLTLEFLDLSNNHLSGPIPPCLNLYFLKYIHLHDNGLTGSFPVALWSSSQIITIDISNNYLSSNLPSWTGESPENLRVLLLKGNHIEGPIPNQMCSLKHLRILDLSNNNISGRIPSCFSIGYGHGGSDSFEYHVKYSDGEIQNLFPSYRGLLPYKALPHDIQYNGVDQEVFKTKSISYSYIGGILNSMSGLDLSCNHLEGEIPAEIGSLSSLHALNLSNNHLSGPIPRTLGSMTELESLDLSHNMLAGPIPRELIQLTSLEAFSVAHNNLSGPTLGTDAQFITFGESSYEDNPNMCGPPLEKNCTSSPAAALPSPLPDEDGDGDHGDDAIDRLVLFGSFALAFVMGFWGYMAVFYFKTGWRRALLNAMDRRTEVCFAMFYGLLRRIKAGG